MFDRFIRLARARKTLEDGRFEEAIRLAEDPLIREDRRADVVRRQAARALSQRAEERLRAGDALAAARDLESALAAGADDQISARLAEARRLAAAEQDGRLQGQRAIDEARRLAAQGRLDAAAAAAQAAASVTALTAPLQSLTAFLQTRRERAAAHLSAA